MTYRFPELANRVATVLAIVLVVFAMDGRWFIGTPASAEPITSPTRPARQAKRDSSPPEGDSGRTLGAGATNHGAGAGASGSGAGATNHVAGASKPGAASKARGPDAGSTATVAELGNAGCGARAGRRALTGTLDLNTATVEQLMLLPGIGPSKAERIVAWRRKHGPFRRTADLRRVSGFGFKTFKRLEAYLAITGPTTLAGG